MGPLLAAVVMASTAAPGGADPLADIPAPPRLARTDAPPELGEPETVEFPQAHLTWLAGPAECGTADEFTEAVGIRLGREAFVVPESADLEVSARFARADDEGWKVTLAYVDRQGTLLGERVLQTPAEQCTALRDAAALVVAMFLEQPRIRSRVQIPEPDYEIPGWALAAGVGAFSAPGLLPDAGLGAHLSVWVSPPSKQPRFLLRLKQSFSTDASYQDSAAVASIDLTAAQLAGCPLEWRAPTWSFGLCATLDAGLMRAAGRRFEVDASVERPLVGGGVFGRFVLWPWTLVGVSLEAGAIGWLERPRLVVQDQGEPGVVFEPWPATPAITVELLFGGP